MIANPRHEHFALLVAGGTRARDAYIRAGFTGKGAAQSASRLAKTPAVANRITELGRAISDALGNGIAMRANVDREWVRDMLKRNALAAFEERNRNAVNRAAELLGRELGMFADARQAGPEWDGDLTKLTDAQLRCVLASLDRMLGPEMPEQVAELGPVVDVKLVVEELRPHNTPTAAEQNSAFPRPPDGAAQTPGADGTRWTGSQVELSEGIR